MAVTSAAQSCVFGPANAVVLHGNPRPMVHGVGQALVAGLSSDHDQALARPLGDWRDSGQTAQGGVVTSLQGIEAFCKQRGENDPSHSRQGCEDLRVMLPSCPGSAPPFRASRAVRVSRRSMGLFDLSH